MGDARRRVLDEIVVERERQEDVHGWGEEHDDRLDRVAWSWLLAKRAVDLSCPYDEAVPDARRQMVEIAAIAVAALESFDRKTGSWGCSFCGRQYPDLPYEQIRLPTCDSCTTEAVTTYLRWRSKT